MEDRAFDLSNSHLNLELRNWIAKKREEGWSTEVIMDSMGQIEQDERHLYNL